ncbi:putative A/G-specific adenine glycosylase YfhQ [Aquisphaera giovannonii]|uniref:Adenine DNA glycosylase n=1 Tax=Aquisphaera giovannonii TaxID=406548 RepID=A0A5B9W467_9BACT|nr:A/G-specific adenine glycosylase [Aquisphaera giovannonii]QEH35403.1 putative A/G-specific adenine glycosylase YfhQ [Aquisphaera giovannonii]
MKRDAGEPVDRSAAWICSIRDRLLSWYAENGRDLPWRGEGDPYRVLLSEMMLVQTTVAAVIPYFARFLERFPDVRSLAEAPESDVLKAWEGLGYYRRARQLHEAARVIVARHAGVIPADAEAVRALPGVGRYMAGAILSFAFDRPEPIVEANTQRVLARLLAWEEDLKTSRSRERLWEAAGRLVPPEGAGRFNQALMDLGATVCTPRAPACLICPLSTLCEARRRGIQDRLPVAAPRKPPLAVAEACVLAEKKGELLVVRRRESGLWAGFWEFPTVHLEGADPAGRSFGEPVDLEEGVRRLTGVRVRVGPEVRALSYGVTKHKVLLRVHPAKAVSGSPRPGPGLSDARWIPPAELPTLTLGAPARKLARWIAEDPKRLEWPSQGR